MAVRRGQATIGGLTDPVVRRRARAGPGWMRPPRVARVRLSALLLSTAIVLLTACASGVAPAPAASPPTPAASGATPAPTSVAARGATPLAPGAAAATAQPASATGPTIHLSASKSVTVNAPVWLAVNNGLFERNGLNVDLQAIGAAVATRQLAAGQLDGLIAGMAEGVSARAAGAPLEVVLMLSTACDMFFVVPNRIASVDQLKGKTVAVINRTSVNGVCTIAYLRKHGLELGTDYQLVEAQQGGSGGTYATVSAVLTAGVVDAGALQPDFARKLIDTGNFHSLGDWATEPGLAEAGAGLTVSAQLVQQHPDQVQRLVDTLLQADAAFKQHPDQAREVLSTVIQVADPDIDLAYTRVTQQFATDPRPRPELFPDLIDVLAPDQPAIKTLDLATFLEPRFAQDAMNRGLTSY